MKKLVPIVLTLAFLLAGCVVTSEGVVFKTADPNLQVLARFQPTAVVDAPALPTVTPSVVPEVVPAEEVGETTPEPPQALIKGNISKSGEKIYHVPGGAYYDQVKIDEDSGESWFVTEEDAQAAGFRKSSR